MAWKFLSYCTIGLALSAPQNLWKCGRRLHCLLLSLGWKKFRRDAAVCDKALSTFAVRLSPLSSKQDGGGQQAGEKQKQKQAVSATSEQLMSELIGKEKDAEKMSRAH